MRERYSKLGFIGALASGRSKCYCHCHPWMSKELAVWEVDGAWKENASHDGLRTVRLCNPCHSLWDEADGIGFSEYCFTAP